ncbi:T9SS type B sorting domain-containing protein [Brumimicrobium mesophilum]|uniref:T9SS type B sorting domain-containing protein n=1 Tax=Brumimicrobium mesophilum TaxID=392717 RepID=UPI000D14149D|nr:gliding motility-associated C-terminal domain-containing protein [Brumimicrobium mesophilum]
MKFILLIASIFIFSFSFSQNVTKVFGGAQNDRGEVIIECANNDIIIGGITTSFGAGGEDIILTRLTPIGGIIWSKAYGLPGNEEGLPLNIYETVNGDILLAFRSNSLTQSRSGVLMRLTSLGNVIWQKEIGDPSGSIEATRGLIEHPDGSIYVGIGTNGSFFGSSDGMVTKLDMNGNIVWSKILGDVLNDHVWNIIPLPNGEIMVNMNSENLGPGNRDALFVKFDNLGNILNQVAFGGTDFDMMTDLDFDPAIGYVVSGGTESFGQGNRDAFIAKFDTSLNLVWFKTYGGTNFDHGSTVQIIDNNHFVMYMNSDLTNPNDKQMTLIGVDSLGTTLYTKSIGDEYDQQIEEYTNQGFVYSPTQNKTFLTNNYSNAANNTNMLFQVIDGLPNSYCVDSILLEAFHTPSVMPITLGITDIGVATNVSMTVTDVTTLIEDEFCPCPFNIPSLSDTTICDGTPLQYNLDPTLNYEWLPVSSFSCSNCPDPLFIGTTNTQVSINIDNNVCFDTLTFSITVNQVSAVNLTGPDTLCESDVPVIFDANGVQGLWSGNGIIDAQNGIFDPLGLSGDIEVYFYTNNICVEEDTLVIFVIPAITATITNNDMILCFEDNPIQLQVSPNTGTWSGFSPSDISGNTFFDPALNSVGVFTIFYTPQGACIIADSIQITVVDFNVDVTENLSLCNNENGNITTSPAGGTWSGVNSAQVIQGNNFIPSSLSPGNYEYVYTVNNGCTKTDTLFVTVHESPNVNLGEDVSIYIGEDFEIELNNLSSSDYITWSTGESSNTILVDEEGQYLVSVMNEFGCIDSDSIYVTVLCEAALYAPNTFTPDNSSVNDQFRVYGDNFTFEHLVIYNKWGQIMFESYDPNGAWDGTYGNLVVQSDTYIYKVEYYECDSAEKKTKMGYINVLK